jgi:hypothetical protein
LADNLSAEKSLGFSRSVVLGNVDINVFEIAVCVLGQQYFDADQSRALDFLLLQQLLAGKTLPS